MSYVVVERHLLTRLVGASGDVPPPTVGGGGTSRQAEQEHGEHDLAGGCREREALHLVIK
jgi:hypothetical protein